tara:strand:- start:1186 stop:1770 length:585 start_codon:yes stop_codon:yes gene_type:complete
MEREETKTGGAAPSFGDTEEALGERCAHPECRESGRFRAPKSRDNLGDYFWFCLDHVREYNAAWNYFADMDDAAIEQALRHDSVWQRPTWPLGVRAGLPRFRDTMNLFHRDDTLEPKMAREAAVQMKAMTGEERRAMSELGLEPPLTRADLKLRYKILAKTLHPDANGGDKKAEERLKSVNHAYKTLRDSDRLI